MNPEQITIDLKTVFTIVGFAVAIVGVYWKLKNSQEKKDQEHDQKIKYLEERMGKVESEKLNESIIELKGMIISLNDKFDRVLEEIKEVKELKADMERLKAEHEVYKEKH